MPQKRYKLSGLTGRNVRFDFGIRNTIPRPRVRIVMEIVAPNGRCLIYEDETGGYARHGKAIRAFVKFGRRIK